MGKSILVQAGQYFIMVENIAYFHDRGQKVLLRKNDPVARIHFVSGDILSLTTEEYREFRQNLSIIIGKLIERRFLEDGQDED